jgi:hypothetical protein
MPTIIEIQTTAFNSESGTPIWAGSQSSSVVEVVFIGFETTVHLPASTQNIIDLSSNLNMTGSGVVSGSWPGNANNWDLLDTSETLVSSSVLSGSWFGNANNLDLYEIPNEIRTSAVTSVESPNVSQGTQNVFWNYFPEPIRVEQVSLGKPRDLARYQKSYSFSRQQPVRIRYVRR